MLHEFLQLHPGLTIAIVGTLLMLNARFDYAVGFLKPVAALIWLIVARWSVLHCSAGSGGGGCSWACCVIRLR